MHLEEIKAGLSIGNLLLSCSFVSGYYSFGGTGLVSAASYFRRKGQGTMSLVGVEGAKPRHEISLTERKTCSVDKVKVGLVKLRFPDLVKK